MDRSGDPPDSADLGNAPTIESTPDDDLGSAASLLRGVADAPGAPIPGTGLLAPAELVADKYRVVRAIGKGGMGSVYLAHDLRLRRDVAIKLCSEGSATALARIEREGQAIAKLSHPNVVVVHEVGETHGRVFVAMEYVQGTARTWLRSGSRSWRDIVTLYAAAGDGLAAAHAAGIVHRDFKPDNVLVGDDDRPRVADFGLALALAGEPDDLSTAGTPAYMAPEQRVAGSQIDGRADQFAFATALTQALEGTRPPGHVVRALERAVAHEPDQRWPTISALVAELRRDVARRRNRLVIAGLVVAGLGAAIVVPRMLHAPATEPCSDADPRLVEIWNDARTAAIAASFAKLGGGPTWTAARHRLERYVGELTTAHHDACYATRVDGTQSEALLDVRMACLARARSQLGAIVAGFATADHTTVETAPNALVLLPDLAACADTQGLEKETALPADPAARAAIEHAEDEIARVNLRATRNDERDPVGSGDRLLATARTTGWAPVIAQAARVRANLLLDAHRDVGRVAMEEAIAAAMACGDEITAAWAMADLARQLAVDHPAEVKPWVDLARAIWSRRGKEPALGSRILTAEISRAWTVDDGASALAFARQRAELSQQAYGDDPFAVATRHYDLAHAHERNVAFADALREIGLAIDAATIATGPEHPLVADYLALQAEIEQRAGAYDASLQHARRALAIGEAWYGKTDPHLAYPLDTMGFLLSMTGDPVGGRAMLDRELSILEAGDPSSPQLANLLANLGAAEAASSHFDKALSFGERALVAHKKWVGAENPALNSDYILLGYAHRGLGQLAKSETDLREGVRVVEASLGAKHPDIVNVSTELSYTLVLENKASDAAALLAPLVELAESNKNVPPPQAAEVHTAYADALWKAGGDRVRARKAALAGRAAFAALGTFKPQLDAADAWLATHR